MKKPDSALWQLIQGLSMAERRYFHIFSTRHFPKDNQYYRLFQAISGQETYDETALHTQFAKGKSKSYFAVLKRQLFDVLLESLHHFETYDDPVQHIIRGVHYSQILLQRGLFEACARSIAKYKSAAYTLEQFEQVIALISLEKKLASRQQFEHQSNDDIDALEQEEIQCLHFIKLNAAYWKHSSHIYKLHYAKHIGPGKNNSELNAVLAHPLFAQTEKAETFIAQLDKLQIHALHAFAAQDAKKAFTYNQSFLQLMDNHPHLRDAHADRYFATLNNYLIDCVLTEQHTALLDGIETLQTLPANKTFRHIPNIQTQVFRISNQLLFNYYIGNENFEAALSIADAVHAGWKQHQSRMAQPHIITLLYLCAYTEINTGFTERCLNTLQHLFAVRHAEDIGDLYASARIMQILAHYERGDILLIDSLISAFNRSAATRQHRSETYTVLFKFLKQSIRNPNKPIKNTLIKNLKKLSTEPAEQRVFNIFNFIYWTERCLAMRK